MNYLNGYNIYSNKDCYLAGYPKVDDNYIQYKGERILSSGKKIRVFNNFEIEHTLDIQEADLLALLFI